MDVLNSAAVRRKITGMSREAHAWFPLYLHEPLAVKANIFARAWFYLLQLPVKAFIWVVLQPRREQPGSLDQNEVDRVYTRQAHGYDRTHHFTTRGQDTIWRRSAGWMVASFRGKKFPDVLDLCTGTGLTVLEMMRVLREHDKRADIIGLDYNDAMLRVACRRFEADAGAWKFQRPCNVRFVRGDATHLIERKKLGSEKIFEQFEPASFDVVTQVFGIGGIDDPISVFRETLSVLREGGQYLLIDMHQPIPNLPGEWPFCGAWIRTQGLEMYTYLKTTVPLALARLWAWRDTTLDFYLAPLICVQDGGSYWGFRIVSRVVEPERWWLALPIMSTCRLLLEKVAIDQVEYERRRSILKEIGI